MNGRGKWTRKRGEMKVGRRVCLYYFQTFFVDLETGSTGKGIDALVQGGEIQAKEIKMRREGYERKGNSKREKEWSKKERRVKMVSGKRRKEMVEEKETEMFEGMKQEGKARK